MIEPAQLFMNLIMDIIHLNVMSEVSQPGILRVLIRLATYLPEPYKKEEFAQMLSNWNPDDVKIDVLAQEGFAFLKRMAGSDVITQGIVVNLEIGYKKRITWSK
jgi:hypothetical protein